MNNLKATLGFKGERGYSAYEIAVQNGYEGTEQDWLATLGTSSHLAQDKAVYIVEEGQTEFNLPVQYTSDSFVDVYVDGSRLNSNEYTIENNKVILLDAQTSSKVEIVEMTMSTNSLPIVTTIDEHSTDSTTPSTKSVYDNILSPLNTNISNVNTLRTEMDYVKNVDFIYPIGSIYMSINNTNPHELFGGIWESIEGQFLIGVGSHTDDNGETWEFESGQSHGEYKHQLTINEIPSHSHQQYVTANNGTGGTRKDYNEDANSERYPQCQTGLTGGDGAHNNMPPYLAVYMWKRIA